MRQGVEKRDQAIRTTDGDLLEKRLWNACIWDLHVGFRNSRMALSRSGSGFGSELVSSTMYSPNNTDCFAKTIVFTLIAIWYSSACWKRHWTRMMCSSQLVEKTYPPKHADNLENHQRCCPGAGNSRHRPRKPVFGRSMAIEIENDLNRDLNFVLSVILIVI